MSKAMELIVASFVKTKNRRALADLLTHWRKVADLQALSGINPANAVQDEIAIIEVGIDELKHRPGSLPGERVLRRRIGWGRQRRLLVTRPLYGAGSFAHAYDANHQAEAITMEISISHDDSHLLLELSGANQERMSARLNRHEAFALIASIAESVNALPSDPAAPLHLQHPVLRSKHPSFQVGIADDGDIVLALLPAPFPSMEFQFEKGVVSKLINDLRKAATVPSTGGGSH